MTHQHPTDNPRGSSSSKSQRSRWRGLAGLRRSALPLEETSARMANLLGAGLPVSLALLELLFLRTTGHPTFLVPMNTSAWLSMVASTPLFLLGLGLLTLALGSDSPGWRNIPVRVIWAVVGALGCVAHAFGVATGTALPFSVVAYAFRFPGDILSIILSELTLARGLGLFGLPLLAMVLPSVIRIRRRKLNRGCLLALSLPALLAAAIIPRQAPNRDMATEPMLTLLEGALTPPRTRGTLDHPALTTLEKVEGAAHPNLVTILLESTSWRATSLSPDGPPTTPFLAKLARGGMLMTHAQPPIPHTTKALVSSLCGITPYPGVDLPETEPGAISTRCLPALLGDQGYQTIHMQTPADGFENRFGLLNNLGFIRRVTGDALEKEGYQQISTFGLEDAALLPHIDTFLRDASRPFYLSILTNAAHHDYRRVDRYPSQTFAPDDELHDRYLNAVHYLDKFLEEIFVLLDRYSLTEQTVVVILGDHGEGFMEHGLGGHDQVPYDEVLHIPWVIVDSRRPPSVVDTPVSQLDLLPTVTELLGFRIPEGVLPGRSLLGPVPPDRPLYFSCFYDERCLGVRRGNLRYVHFYDRAEDALFDLQADPEEGVNLLKQGGDASQYRQEALSWAEEAARSWP